MIYTPKNGTDIVIVDNMGKKVPLVTEYNTETKETKLIVTDRYNQPLTWSNGDEGGIVEVSVVLHGSKAMTKEEYESQD